MMRLLELLWSNSSGCRVAVQPLFWGWICISNLTMWLPPLSLAAGRAEEPDLQELPRLDSCSTFPVGSQPRWLHSLGHFALCFLSLDKRRVFSAPNSPPFTNAKSGSVLTPPLTCLSSIPCFVCPVLPFPPGAVGCAEKSSLTSDFCLPL